MKFWKRLLSLTLIGVMMVCMLSSCALMVKDDGKFKIGYVNLADTDVFCSSRKEAVDKALTEDGSYSISFSDGNNDIQKQIDQTNAFLAQGADAIIIIPTDAAGIVPAVKACNKKGVPCILIGNAADPSECEYIFIGSPHYNSGYMEGEYIGKLLQESVGIENSRILYLEGTNGLDHAALRKQGTQDALKELGFDWDTQCLDSQDADYVKDKAMKIVDAWKQTFVSGGTAQFQAIIAANDQMALGAMESLRASKLLGNNYEIYISGIDGTADGINAVIDGGMVQTVLQDAAGQGEACLEVLNQLLKDGKQMSEVGDPSETYPGITEIMVDYQSVTKENVDDYKYLLE